MEPRVSVIVNVEGACAAEVVRAVRSLRRQSEADWEGLLVGQLTDGAAQAVVDTLPAAEPRLRWCASDATDGEALGTALNDARGEFALVLDGHDELHPTALVGLLEGAEKHSHRSAIARYGFRARIGDLPGDPVRGVGATISIEYLQSAKRFALSGLIAPRELLLDHVPVRPLDSGGDYELMLSMLASGVTCGFVEKRLVTCHLRQLLPHEAIVARLADHFSVADSFFEQPAQPIQALDAAQAHLARQQFFDGFVLLEAFRRTYEGEGRSALISAPRVEFGNLFATWWQRLGFHGLAPRHLAPTVGTTPELIAARPQTLAARIADDLDRDRPVELLGLGKNARFLAIELAQRGFILRGRDDNLSDPPDWAQANSLALTMVPSSAPYDPSIQYVLTPINDKWMLERLPENIRAKRWNDAHGLLLRDLIDSFSTHRARATTPTDSTSELKLAQQRAIA